MKGLFFIGLLGVSLLSAKDFEEHISERQAHCIETICYSLGEKSTFSLAVSALQLYSMGKEIQPVPPLEFLSYMLKKPDLVGYMQKTQNKSYQWSQFIGKFEEKCNNEEIYKTIKEDLEFFAEDVGVQRSELYPYVVNHDWDGLVKYLLKRRGL